MAERLYPKPISIRIDADLRVALEQEAAATNRTLGGLVKHILRTHIEQVWTQIRTPIHPPS
jgi:hypothetical protein